MAGHWLSDIAIVASPPEPMNAQAGAGIATDSAIGSIGYADEMPLTDFTTGEPGGKRLARKDADWMKNRQRAMHQ